MCSRGSIHFSKQDRRSCAPRQPHSNVASGSRLELFETDLKVGQYQDHNSGVAERVIESVTLRSALTFPATSLRICRRLLRFSPIHLSHETHVPRHAR